MSNRQAQHAKTRPTGASDGRTNSDKWRDRSKYSPSATRASQRGGGHRMGYDKEAPCDHEWEEALFEGKRCWVCAVCEEHTHTHTRPAELGCDHVWKWISDWGGDSTVPGGTFDCSHWQCAKCGSDECDDDPPIAGDDYDEDLLKGDDL